MCHQLLLLTLGSRIAKPQGKMEALIYFAKKVKDKRRVNS